MAKLFRQRYELPVEDSFYIVANNKEEATESFSENIKEIQEYLTDPDIAIPLERGECEEVADLSPEEEREIKEVIWNKTGLRVFLLRQGLMKLREAIK